MKPSASDAGGSAPPPGRRVSRRHLFSLAGAGVAGVAVVGGVTDYAAGGVVRKAATRLTGKTTTSASLGRAFTVNTSTSVASAGDIFLTNMGTATPAPVIADPTGATVWATTGQKSYTDCRLQTYLGNPVITWWESPTTGLAAYASGRDIVTNLDHQVIATIGEHNGVSPDEHEFYLTDHGTAYIVSYVEVERDFSDLSSKMHNLFDNPNKAQKIADNSVKTFRERYLTPAAEACYWRALWRGYSKVSEPADLWRLEVDGSKTKRGLRYETFVLLSSDEMLDFAAG